MKKAFAIFLAVAMLAAFVLPSALSVDWQIKPSASETTITVSGMFEDCFEFTQFGQSWILLFEDDGTIMFDRAADLGSMGETVGTAQPGEVINVADIDGQYWWVDDNSYYLLFQLDSTSDYTPDTPVSALPVTIMDTAGNVISEDTYVAAEPISDTVGDDAADAAEAEEVFDMEVPIEIWELSAPGGAGYEAHGFNGLWLQGGIWRGGEPVAAGDYDPELDTISPPPTNGSIIFALYNFSFATFTVDSWATPEVLANFQIEGYTRVDRAAEVTPGTFAIEIVSGGQWSYLFLMPPASVVVHNDFTVGPPADFVPTYPLFTGPAGVALRNIVIICLILTIPLAIVVYRAQVREIKSRGRTFAKPVMMNRK
jgi:hypothetical protein